MVLKDAINIFHKITYLKPNQTVDSDLYVVAVHTFSFVTSPAQAKRLPYQRNQKPTLESRIFSFLKYLSSISKKSPKNWISDQRKEKKTLKNVNAMYWVILVSHFITCDSEGNWDKKCLLSWTKHLWQLNRQISARKTSQPMNYASFQFLV